MKPLTIILGALGIGALGYYAYKNYQPGQKAAASFGPLPPLPEPVLLPAKVDKPTVITSTVSSAAPATKVTASVLEQILKPSTAPVTAPAPLPALTSVKLVNETVTVPGTNEQIVVPTIKPVYTQPAPQPAPAPVYVKPTPVVESYSEPVYYNAPIEQYQPSYEQKEQTYLEGCLI